MKGQYFSFDAVVAAVIMVVAFTALVSYWFGAQSVIEDRANPMYADALRISDMLISPGFPQSWQTDDPSGVFSLDNTKQIGLTLGFGNELDRKKLERLKGLIPAYGLHASNWEGNYAAIGRLLRASGDYYIIVEQTDTNSASNQYTFGKPYPENATSVAVAHRGATLEGHPMRLRIFIWRQ